MAIRCCDTCAYKEGCLLKNYPDVDENTGCVNWFEDPVGLQVVGVNDSLIDPSVVIECKKIILTHKEARIEIDSDLLKNFSVIVINGRKYVLEDK